MTSSTAEQTKKRVQERDYKQSRSTYLQDRISQIQEQLKGTGLETDKRLALQKSLKSMKDNLSKIKSQSSVTNPIKEISNMSNVKKRAIEQATASLEELAAPSRTGGGMSKAPNRSTQRIKGDDDAEIQDKAPRKTATKKTDSSTTARNSKAAKEAEIKAITDLENKFNNNLKASGPRDPKVKDLHKKLVERKEKFNDTYKSAKPFYYIAEPVKRGSTPLDKLKPLYLEIENTRNDKTRERLVKQADSIEKKLSPADAKAAKRLLGDNEKSRKDELNKKVSSKSKWDKVADIKKYAKQLNATTDASKKPKLSNTIAELYGSLTAAERKTVALNTIVSKRDMKLMAGHDKAVEKLFNNPATSFYTPGQVKLNFAKDQKASNAKAPAKADPMKDANGKRYTKRGVTKMINELKDANERGRKTSAAYKKREEDIKRLSKILKTLTTTAGVSASDTLFLDNVVTAGIETDISDIAQATGLILGIQYRDFQDRNEFYQIVPEAGESRRVELQEVEDVVDTLDEYGIKDAILVDKKSPRASVSFDATLNNKTYRVVLESSKGTLRITGQYD